MKLLLEQWRQFVNEEYEPITTLRVFDFDETIAHTRSVTRVTAPDGSTFSLSDQKEFDSFMSSMAEKEGIKTFDPVSELIKLGYKMDFSDFGIVKEPTEITIVTDVLRTFPTNSKTYVMTARRGNSIGPILDYLEDIGIDSSKVRPIATQGQSKGATIAQMISNKIMSTGKSNITRVEYYEDSDKNIQDVLDHICRGNIDAIKTKDFELVIYKVISNGDGYTFEKIGC